jgi:hypothetical protein
VPMSGVSVQATIQTNRDGSVTTASCPAYLHLGAPYLVQRVNADGSLAWRRPDESSESGRGPQCHGFITGRDGNAFFLDTTQGQGRIRSIGPSGRPRWTSPDLESDITSTDHDYDSPVIGHDGNVYFSARNGFRGYVVRADADTGTVRTLKDLRSDAYVGLSAYNKGLALTGGRGSVEYVDYSGDSIAHYDPPVGDLYTVPLNAGDSAGEVYVAGRSRASGCSGSASGDDLFIVAKYAPSGRQWTWSVPSWSGCWQGTATPMPDGAVLVTYVDDHGDGRAAAIGADGTELWEHPALGNGYLVRPAVDINGVVAVPNTEQYDCITRPERCQRLRIDFLDSKTGIPRMSPIWVRGETAAVRVGTGAIPFPRIALGKDRLYVEAQPEWGNTSPSTLASGLASISVPGLGEDYTRARQFALQP